MKPVPELRSLLEDVLASDAPAGSSAGQLGILLHIVRRRRRARHIRRIASTTALCVLTGWWIAYNFRAPTIPTRSASTTITTTSPRPEDSRSWLVRTRPLSPEQTVRTYYAAPMMPTSSTHVGIVETATTPRGWDFIDDAALLVLLRDQGAMLVRHGPDDVQVVPRPTPEK